MGFISALLNPKNALFYGSLFSLLTETDRSVQALYGVWMVCAVLGWDLLIAVSAGHRVVVERFARHLGRIERTTGVLLLLHSGWRGCSDQYRRVSNRPAPTDGQHALPQRSARRCIRLHVKTKLPCAAFPSQPSQGVNPMLKYAIIFALISLVAGALGFTGVAAGAAGIAKVLFVIFLIIAVVFIVLAILGVGAARKVLK